MNKDKLKKNFNRYRVHKTLTEMLLDRGYNVFDEDKFTYLEFIKKFPHKRNMVMRKFPHKEDRSQDILVAYLSNTPNKNSVSVDSVKIFIGNMLVNDELRGTRGLIITKGDLSHKAKEYINLASNVLIIEHFFESKLFVNITQHRYVPKHELLNAEETEEFYKQLLIRNEYNIQDKLPKLFTNDPICIYYSFPVNSIIRITRSIPIKSISYRIVIQS